MNQLTRRAKGKSERRQAMLNAALKVFAKEGFSGAHMETVATLAGISKPTLYQYFPSKEHLFIAVMEAKRDVMLIAIETADPEKLVEQLSRFAQTYARYVLSPDMLSLARLIIGEAERFPAIGRAYQAAGPDKLLCGMKTYLEAQRSAGTLDFADADLAAEDLWALILSAPRNRALHDPEWKPSADEMSRHISHGLVAFLKLYSTNPAQDIENLALYAN